LGEEAVKNLDQVKVTGEWLFIFADPEGGIQEVRRHKNLITQAGLNFLAALLINEYPNDIPIHLAMGTGTTPASAGDTKLQAEGIRKFVSAKTRQANLLRLRVFFGASEANGTWNELGIFLAGTDLPDNGTLFNRLLPPGGISKASNTVLTVEARITFSAS
jgi:hypothetical protein